MQVWTVEQAEGFIRYVKTLDLEDGFPPAVASSIEGFVEGMQGSNFWLNERCGDDSVMGAVSGYLAGRALRQNLRAEARERGLPDIDDDEP